MKLTNIGTHHFAGLKDDPRVSTQNLSEKHINNAHMSRWPEFVSRLGSHIGYNFVIYPFDIKQYRMIGEQTAGIIGHNSDTVHICLAGNFTEGVDKPTQTQIKLFTELRDLLLTNDKAKIEAAGFKIAPDAQLNLTLENVKPHRLLSPKGYTECYGSSLSDDWARTVQAITPNPIISEIPNKVYEQSIQDKIYAILLQISRLLKSGRLGSGLVDRDDTQVEL